MFWLLERLPSRSLKGLKDVARVGDMVAHQLIKEHRQALEQALESPPRDVLSLLCPYLASRSDFLKLMFVSFFSASQRGDQCGRETYRRRAFGQHEVFIYVHASFEVNAVSHVRTIIAAGRAFVSFVEHKMILKMTR